MKHFGWSVWVLVAWVALSVFGQIISIDSTGIEVKHILNGPSWQSWFGYDDLGRSVFNRLLSGSYTSCVVSLTVITISVSVGTIIGTISGYLGGFVDTVIVRIIDIFLAFPGILLAIALAGIMGSGVDNVVIALSIVGWVGFARLARAQTLSIKHREHVLAAEAMGTRRRMIIVRHLIPLISTPIMVEATFGVASVIIAEAGLSFLGLGVQAPDASWGSMIRDGTRYMLIAPHLVLIPGVVLMSVVLSVNLAGDRLRDWMDVKTRFDGNKAN
ncbi:MAG TPA: ABC transporter permease [Gammaproteobacteria bacterium]|nr:ABC transporter permease [Gammaproteobacteria bacterium]